MRHEQRSLVGLGGRRDGDGEGPDSGGQGGGCVHGVGGGVTVGRAGTQTQERGQRNKNGMKEGADESNQENACMRARHSSAQHSRCTAAA